MVLCDGRFLPDLTLRLTFSKSLLQQVVFSLQLRDKVTAIQILFKFLELKTKQRRRVKTVGRNSP